MAISNAQPHAEMVSVGRRALYGAAVVVNVLLLLAVLYLPIGDWVPFLTDDFALLIPWISASLLVTIAVNVVYQFDDSKTMTSLGQVVTGLVGLAVTYRTFQVFPFDFSSYEFNWAPVARTALIVAMFGCLLGVLTGILGGTREPKERR